MLVTSPFNQQLMGLAVNADTLFWGTYPNQTQGEIRSMPLAGGPSTLLVSNVIVSELYLDGATLYYVTNDRTGNAALLAIPVTGGTSRMVATGSRIAWITSDASGIYFAQGNQIVRADRSGSGVTPVVGAAGTLWGFAVDETNVYWASYSNGGALFDVRWRAETPRRCTLPARPSRSPSPTVTTSSTWKGSTRRACARAPSGPSRRRAPQRLA